MTNFSFAQEEKTENRDKPQFGFKLGTNFSNVYDTEGEQFNTDPKFGLVFGAFMSIPFGDLIGVQPEVLYSQKGFKATGIILGEPYEFILTTTYIDIPLLFAVKPAEVITIVAGPQFSYLIKERYSFTIASSSIEQEQEFENDNLRKNMLCFTGGLTINLDKIVIGTRAGWDIQKNTGDGTSTTPRYKNVWYQATIGYRF
ncbi:MAG: hypothetical protein A2W91_08355 [Bacteroidetes bacterium GWF2_38_335]|nr:MAG: hypothetical protein A2W91_08355 [Bacteroidetes bacterium GWF2_38_335]OFY78945.1 MAG: hypothetical protein A2281_02365 [Bacteroidetes bacterium RIFOXYA12_FULL_38_20]